MRFAVLSAVCAAALCACSPEAADDASTAGPGPAEAGAAADAGCAGEPSQALIDLCTLASDAMQGRLVGTEGNALARDYLIRRFEEAGLAPVGEGYVHAFDFERAIDFRDPDSPRETLTGRNLVGLIEGTGEGGPALVITAHYDHVGPGETNEIFNGADDNASGVAALLAIASAFDETPPRNDVVFIAFDAEEGGLNGARAYVANPPEGAPLTGLNFNLDMLGYSPDGDIWAAGTYHTPSLLLVVEAAAGTARVDLKAGYDRPTGDPREDWTLLSDHGPFHSAGLPFLYLGVEDHEHYHRPSDEYAIIDPQFYGAVVDLSIDLARRLDGWLAEQSEAAE